MSITSSGLLKFADRVYVFDSCFCTEVVADSLYQTFLHQVINGLHKRFPESSFLAFNVREGEKRSVFTETLCEYGVTVFEYPNQYEGCPLLPLSLIQRFLHECESWLARGNCQDVVLFHCESGGWPLLAFVLASFLVFRKIHSGERRTLELVHREAPEGLLERLSPLNPLPSQLRYLQYVARRNLTPVWPPPERSLSLDCVIIRAIPNFDSQHGCRPIIRIFGSSTSGVSTEMLYSSNSDKNKPLRHYPQAECDVIKIDIQCWVQGDVVLECVHQDLEPEREVMMFRVMFNTVYIRSNILILNSDNLDVLWEAKDRYPKGFRAEVLFGEVENALPQKAPTPILNGDETGGLPIEAFSRVQELFSGVDLAGNGDDAALWLLKQLAAVDYAKEFNSPDSEEETNTSSASDSSDEGFDLTLPSDPPSSVAHVSRLPPPPLSKAPAPPPPPLSKASAPPPPPPPPAGRGRASSRLGRGRGVSVPSVAPKKTVLKALHWSKVTRATEGSLWADTQRQEDQTRARGIDILELETLFSAPPPQANISNAPLPLPPSSERFGPPPPPPPPPPPTLSKAPAPPPPPPPPLHSFSSRYPPPTSHQPNNKTPPPPPPPPFSKNISPPSTQPPPPPPSTKCAPPPQPPPPPPPPPHSGPGRGGPPLAPPPPPPLPPSSAKLGAPPPPPPPPLSKTPAPPPPPLSEAPAPQPPPLSKAPGPPPPPVLGRGIGSDPPPLGAEGSNAPPPPPARRERVLDVLTPWHWSKFPRAAEGTLWADAQKQENQRRAPTIDILDLKSFFTVDSVTTAKKDAALLESSISKKIRLIEKQRAMNCEIMLTRIKMSFPDILSAVLALDSSSLDIDQVKNLNKFCPTKEEMVLLRNYTGDKEMLGKCEQYFLELMKVPRIEAKLLVFSFKITFASQVEDLKSCLNTIDAAANEVKESSNLQQIMLTILRLGNALNQGTFRGCAAGFKLDSLLKLSDTRARNKKMTLMHYLCKIVGEKMPELLDFPNDLVHLEAASKIEWKTLAEDMQAETKGLENVEQELAASEDDGAISSGFRNVVKEFFDIAQEEVKSLVSLYSEVKKNADSLCQYLGEDPARCPFEQVTKILTFFMKTFIKSREENEKQAEAEKKKLAREAIMLKSAIKKDGTDNGNKLNHQIRRHRT